MSIGKRFKRKVANRYGYFPRSYRYHEREARHRKIAPASGGGTFAIERTNLPGWVFWGLWLVAIGLFYALIFGGYA